ncbi:MAG: PAS domain-containing protein [Bacteroidota bacterium]
MGKCHYLIAAFVLLPLGILAQRLEVGVFPNYPLVYQSKDGQASGIFIDILEDIAKKEGWQLQYKYGTADQCLAWLGAGDIDILSEIGQSVVREEEFDISRVSVISTWARVYARNNSDFTFMTDLGNRKIGVLRGSYFVSGNEMGFLKNMADLDLKCRLVEMDSYEEIFKAIENGIVEAGIVNRVFGDLNEDKYDVAKTPIEFSPFRLTYAFPKGSQVSQNIKPVIETYLTQYKEDDNSIYYQSIDKYFKNRGQTQLPMWVWLLMTIVVAILSFVFFANKVLKFRVKRRTVELRQTLKQLAETERKSRLSHFTIEASDVAYFWIDRKGIIKKVNSACTRMMEYSAEELIGTDVNEIELPEGSDTDFREVWTEVKERGSVQHNTQLLTKTGKVIDVEFDANYIKFEEEEYSCGIVRNVTDRNKALRALKRSEQQLNAIMGNVPGVVYRCKNDQVLTPIFISEGSNELLGVSAEEALSKYKFGSNLLSKDFVNLILTETQRAIKEDTMVELVLPLNTDNGVKWVLDRFRPRDDNGEIVIDGIAIDITDKIENEFRLQMALEGAHEGLWDWDVITGKVFFNEYFLEMLGYDMDDIEHTFESVVSLVHPEDHETTENRLRRHLKNETDYYETEYRMRTKEGDWKWVMVHGRVIERDKLGNPLRAIGTHMMIDDRKKAEFALKESERMLSTLMSNLPGMVYRCKNDRDWSMLFVSEGSEKLTGCKPQDLISGHSLYNDMIDRAYREQVWDQIQEAVKNNCPFTLIYPINVNGKKKWVWENGRMVFVDENRNTILEGFITDITERITAEERIISTIIETEDRERMRIAKELHDNLGQKLTTVSLNFNSLKKETGTLSEKGQGKFLKGLEYLKMAINESREISHNLMPSVIEDFGYVLAVQNMIYDLEDASGVDFSFYDNLSGERLERKVEVNLYRITQEAINNILKYANASKVTVQLMKLDDYLVLTIEDDGVGFNVKNTLRGPNSFGLNSMKNRTYALQGKFHIDSGHDNGTSITIEIPLIKDYAGANKDFVS